MTLEDKAEIVISQLREDRDRLQNIIEQIRAEIKTKSDSISWRNTDYDDGWIEALDWVVDDVIDKYIESEVEK